MLVAFAAMAFGAAAYEAARLPALRHNATAYSHSRPCRPFEDNAACYQVTAARVDDTHHARWLVLDVPSGPPVTVEFAVRNAPVVNIGEPVDIITWRGDVVEIHDLPRTFHTDAYPETRVRQGYGPIAEFVAIGVGLLVCACGGNRAPGLLAAATAALAAILQSQSPIMAATPFVAITGGACLTALILAAEQLITTWSAARRRTIQP
jgi:hypothetical protein